MAQELWKKIINIDNYEISNFGNVRNLKNRNLLKKTIKNGYYYVNLYDKSYRINKLVATHYLVNDNPESKIYVNHIDGDKFNNHVDNLEFITPSNNVKHAIRNNLLIVNKIKVGKYDKITKELITVYDSIINASNATSIDDGTICKVCKYYQFGTGINKSGGGYIWKYIDYKKYDYKNNDDKLYVIKNYPNYCITENGKIYSNLRKRFLNLTKNLDGYMRVHLINKNGRKSLLVHRLVAETFIQNPENKSFVNHINMIKNDNRKINLEWVTNSENIIHANKNKNK